MLIYEVNLTVNEGVATAYVAWLREHIAQILRLDGFRYASMCEEEEASDADARRYVVHYYVEDRVSLEAYFANHAAGMRRDGVERFGDAFSATRRVLEIVGEFQPEIQVREGGLG